MKHKLGARALGLLVAGMLGVILFFGPRAITADTRGYGEENNVEVLTRGPVHEAFAEPNNYNATPPVVVPRQAPAAIDEIPPDRKPQGNVQWIPGYWQWDSERSDFIWVSGTWRVPPPGTGWVPGYWTALSNGWTWTSGFWMSSASDEVDYLPNPPESLEAGPSSPAPAGDYIWAPGGWSWTDNRQYSWRPGYWVQARSDWVWSPAHYVRTPRGSIYVDGYWDWTFDRRGVLFAPVHIPRSSWRNRNYTYSPSIAIQIDALTAHLFIGPKFGHYYFGDYYGTEYSRRGIFPWFSLHNTRNGYDPIYAHERWRQNRRDSHWEERVRKNYDYRVRHTDARPSRSYSRQDDVVRRTGESQREHMRIGLPISEFAKRENTPIRYEKMGAERHKSFVDKVKDLAQFREQRAKWESPDETRSNDKDRPARVPPRNPREVRDSRQKEKTKSHENPHAGKSTGPVQTRSDRTLQRPNDLPDIRRPQQPQERREETGASVQMRGPHRQKIPKSPVADESAENPRMMATPPNRPELPQPDMNRQPNTGQAPGVGHPATGPRGAPGRQNWDNKTGGRSRGNR